MTFQIVDELENVWHEDIENGNKIGGNVHVILKGSLDGKKAKPNEGNRNCRGTNPLQHLDLIMRKNRENGKLSILELTM